MADVHCFTSISFCYLDRARVLAETVKRFHPDWVLWLCLSDREPAGFRFNIEDEAFDRLMRVDDFGIADLPAWIFGHQVVELCTAVKGAMLKHILGIGARKVIYLDPDIALFDTLAPVVELLDRHSVILTPHLLAPEETRTGVIDNEICALQHGAYNLGFIAVAGSVEGRAFAEWWSTRLYDFCYDEISTGLFTDQRWCDLVPGLFPRAFILRDPGYNVACWNISNRRIRFTPEGEIFAGDAPLRFFHFTKISTVGEAVLEYHSEGQIEAFELLRWYKARLARNAVEDLPANYWAFACYEDGTLIPPSHRVAFRMNSDLSIRFPNPFASGRGSYQEWCSANLP